MTTKHTKQEMVDFFHDIFNPIGDDLIDVKAYDIMGQYLTQIEQELENQSMTQKQLAEKIGTSASYISHFFNLNKLINLKTLAKIELALGIDFELKQPTENSKTSQIRNSNISSMGFIDSNIDFSASNESPYVAAQVHATECNNIPNAVRGKPLSAEQLWDIYAKAVGGKTFDGKPLPEFDKLGAQQAGWLAVADEMSKHLERVLI